MAESRASPDEVLAWMRETGRGAKAAGKHFGIPVTTIKSWRTRGRRETQGDAGGRASPGGGRRAGRGGSRASAGTTTARARIALDLADLATDDREHLRGAARRLLGYLDSEDALKDGKNTAAIARALESLLRTAPDILTFDERTGGRVDAGGDGSGEAAAERVLRALEGGRSRDPG